MSKIISVILPCAQRKPVGGYKIIYEYVDRLAEKNYELHIFYLCKCKMNIKCYLKKIYYAFIKKDFYKWSNLKKRNNVKHHLFINKKFINNSNILFVTSVETAVFVKKEKLDLNKKVLYFIQHFENWNLKKEEVIKTYHYGYINIVVSKWLESILKKNKAKVDLYLPNGIDKAFIKNKPIEKRTFKSILFLYHQSDWKGSKEAIEVVTKLKEIYKDLEISCFSAFDKPEKFPNFIKFIKLPEKKELVKLYNNHTFFLSTSYYEGFGLPAAEAMKCGCCVVTTKNGGVEDFAIHNKTAILLSTPPNVNEIVEAFKQLFNDKDLVIKISNNGENYIKKFDYDKNVLRLLEILK